jgi:hypothetical protein
MLLSLPLRPNAADFEKNMPNTAGTRKKYRPEVADVVPRSTVDWDTSQADDFRTRGEPWTIK